MRTEENSNDTFLPKQLINFSIRTLSRKNEIHPHDGVRRAKSNMSNNRTFVRSQAEIMAHSPRRELVDGQKLLFASKTGPMQRHDASTPVPKRHWRYSQRPQPWPGQKISKQTFCHACKHVPSSRVSIIVSQAS